MIDMKWLETKTFKIVCLSLLALIAVTLLWSQFRPRWEYRVEPVYVLDLDKRLPLEDQGWQRCEKRIITDDEKDPLYYYMKVTLRREK